MKPVDLYAGYDIEKPHRNQSLINIKLKVDLNKVTKSVLFI